MKKSAFTMLELVFAIVVIGILASLAMPRIDRDIRQEAADNILSAIRYTQHMALMDDVVVPSRRAWQRSYWSFGTQGCTDDIFYEIGADKDMGNGAAQGNIDDNEAARDPANGKRLNAANGSTRVANINLGSSPNIFLGKQYGVNNIVYAGGCNTQHIAFDYMGRPHSGIRGSASPDMSTLLQNDCTITFTFSDVNINPLIITIRQETGYATVNGQLNL